MATPKIPSLSVSRRAFENMMLPPQSRLCFSPGDVGRRKPACAMRERVARRDGKYLPSLQKH
jgi:hypothetical protein